ncbi:hypothetical protein DB30_01292 [Enhygromyxa salina]|uniref:Tetratricopeptide repeat protein n=1 Tax=Enhygromyxa salina TaxID=215803 RepID=A0A0C2CSA3_9BACT|nr:hypothetical protein [Enhygromyxa salina]KIG12530.1 hypothetical protein DB30_01292 [Enhygromyxa salina]
MRLLRVPVALLLTLSLPSVAFAQYPLRPMANAAPSEELSEDEKIEKAKGLYIEAERLAAEDNWDAAVILYEQAYYLVPGKHGFAHKVGVAAWKVHDCDKAFDYMTHFIEYADPEKQGDKIGEAQTILDEIAATECRTPEAETKPETKPEEATDVEDPFAVSNGTTDKPEKQKGGNGLLAGGAVLITLGVGGIVVGGVGSAMAVGAGNRLDELASTSTNTGYSTGDYACRDAGVDCPVSLEGRLGTGKALTYAGFIGGGVLLVTGVALIALHAKKKKGNAGAAAKAKTVELTALGPALLPGGGGGSMALRF